MTFIYNTPPRNEQVLLPSSSDSTLTKRAKKFIANSGAHTTPLPGNAVEVDSISRGKTKQALSFFTPRKSFNAIYRWKVDVKEGNKVVPKRLIGYSCNVRKRLSAYYTALRAGNIALAKIMQKRVKSSVGVLYSNVPGELLGRVEKLLIKVHKLSAINQRAGGGGASAQKPLTRLDKQLVRKVTAQIATTNLREAVPFKVVNGKIMPQLTASQRMAVGVIYDIENVRKGKHYIGKTETFLRARISQHVSAIFTSKREKRVHRAIRKNPQDFVLRVLYQAPVKKRHILPAVEHEYIKAFGSHEKKRGYNSTIGSRTIF